MAKPTRTATELQALLQARIDAIPDLVGQITDIQAGGVVWVDTGTDGGANWTVRRTRNMDTYRTDIARIIRDVQREFDLED